LPPSPSPSPSWRDVIHFAGQGSRRFKAEDASEGARSEHRPCIAARLQREIHAATASGINGHFASNFPPREGKIQVVGASFHGTTFPAAIRNGKKQKASLRIDQSWRLSVSTRSLSLSLSRLSERKISSIVRPRAILYLSERERLLGVASRLSYRSPLSSIASLRFVLAFNFRISGDSCRGSRFRCVFPVLIPGDPVPRARRVSFIPG